ncbi:DNA-binding transcriptional regulator, MarR family [Actinoalloteichus cyanogriseus DSM 43889]|uniref:DNA-binding transcriptional regulator, MarR family n=1 Tax=Actinoalloteichus caeruleus DSM 43889 TaxID=1120930 RepID=A0ABT1JC09_ACTCY|nr:DNA-binding transcriptional regulator, MarR family [Actinoalloteichus caeruleus DSM 43889]
MTPHTPPSPDGPPDDPGGAVSSWPTGRLLSVAARLVESSWEEYLRTRGLTHAGLIALHVLSEDGPSPQRPLARRCKVTDQTMSRTVEGLRRAGYVRVAADQRDRRRMLVTPTAQGLAVHEEALEAERSDPAVLRGLADYQTFRDQLLRLIGALGGAGTPPPLPPDPEPTGDPDLPGRPASGSGHG